MTTDDLRKAATCVFLAAEADVAKDLSEKLTWAADRIDALEKTYALEQEATIQSATETSPKSTA